ncbi:MAG: hypothetical protein KGR26_13515 [Cyanobacteria bacterium REEB65]|nr:hypothetical protein [Cyanobacteria bacterium REEB65]
MRAIMAMKGLPLPSARELGSILVEKIVASLLASGWEVERGSGGSLDAGVDLRIFKGPVRYAVEVKVAREARRDDVEAHLASALLQVRAHADPLGLSPLAIVGAPSISDALAEHLRAFGQRFGGGLAFGIADLRGRLELFGFGLSLVSAPQGPPLWQTNLGNRVLDMYSDTNQWLLKVLLAQRLPANLLQAPRGEVKSATDLARMAEVSLPTAARLVKHLEQIGRLERAWQRLSLVRVESLLQRWRAAVQRSSIEVGTKFVLPKGRPEEQLRQALVRWSARQRPVSEMAIRRREDGRPQVQPTACLGLFAACAWLGIGLVQGVPSHLYVEEVDQQLLETFGLREVEPGEQADVILRVARWPRSIFRAAPRVPVPICDIVQIWLDTVDHPLRGRQQADSIWNSYLAPMLLKE